MIIDFHTHIFPDKIAERSIEALSKVSGITAATDGTLNGLLVSMERSGVDLSVIMPVVTKPSQFESVNTFAASINKQYTGKLLSFGGIHPDSEDYRRELNLIKELGLQGIKLHPDYQGVMIDDVRYMNIMEYADALGLVILVHAGVDIGLPEPVHCSPDKARKVIDTLNPKKLVLAHMGGWKQWEEVYEYLAGEQVYLDTAFCFDYMSREIFLKLCEKHGTDRILFGTDSPWSEAGRDMEVINNLPLAKADKEAIFFGNAMRLLNI
ncbi:MAG: amidohydrolase family protein [Lachnospiraceae bacterium]|nr:amidohydrolase family protein [Lachnospiraceae bacterium]